MQQGTAANTSHFDLGSALISELARLPCADRAPMNGTWNFEQERLMRALNAMTLATAIALAPTIAVAAQREATAAEEMKAVRAMAAAIPLGSRVKVQSRSGRRLTATLMAVTDEAIVVKREARVPEPAVTIRYDELARLERSESGGFSIVKGIGIGLAAGAGAILTMFAIAMSIDD